MSYVLDDITRKLKCADYYYEVIEDVATPENNEYLFKKGDMIINEVYSSIKITCKSDVMKIAIIVKDLASSKYAEHKFLIPAEINVDMDIILMYIENLCTFMLSNLSTIHDYKLHTEI